MSMHACNDNSHIFIVYYEKLRRTPWRINFHSLSLVHHSATCYKVTIDQRIVNWIVANLFEYMMCHDAMALSVKKESTMINLMAIKHSPYENSIFFPTTLVVAHVNSFHSFMIIAFSSSPSLEGHEACSNVCTIRSINGMIYCAPSSSSSWDIGAVEHQQKTLTQMCMYLCGEVRSLTRSINFPQYIQ